jgi:non-ribosomal peptide synthetase component F
VSIKDSTLEEKRSRARALLRQRASLAPASFAQERLWFIDQIASAPAAYNMPCAFRLSGALDTQLLRRVLDEIVRRHAVLRTRLATRGGQIHQEISDAFAMAFSVIDLTERHEKERDVEVEERAVEEAKRPFDLSKGPLSRAMLLRLSATEHVLLCNMHHTVSDGWSIGILVREFVELYRAFFRGDPSTLPEISLQYTDYAAWQRGRLASGALEAQLSYWKAQLGGALPALELPTDRPRPAVQSFRGATAPVVLPRDLALALAELSREENVTLFMVLLAAFQVLLHRYTAQEGIVVGVPIAGRNRAELEPLIGLFVNTLPLRIEFSAQATFRELLLRVKATTLDAYANQDVPFEKLVEELSPSRNMSRTPIFQSMFALQSEVLHDAELPGGVTLSPMPLNTGTAKFDLLLSLTESKSGLHGFLEYSSDLFDASTIARMVERFEALLRAVVAHPERKVSELSLLTPSQRVHIVRESSTPGRDLARTDLGALVVGDVSMPWYVVDSSLQPVPIGIAGELVGGDPSDADLHRTGVLVRRRGSGEFEYLGRIDSHLAIRGYRVDTDDIAALLAQHASVREAAVLTQSTRDRTHLVAYVACRADRLAPTPSELQAHLEKTVPEGMIPSAFVFLEQLPRSADGTIECLALPPAELGGHTTEPAKEPETPLQRKVSDVWKQVLELDSVGIHDNFFECGGTSLNLAALAFRIQEVSGVEIPVRALYETPTIAQQAALLERQLVGGATPPDAPIVPRPTIGEVPVSFGQERIWRWQALAPDCTAYHIPIAVRIEGPLEASAVERALMRFQDRHEVLRTVYREVGGQVVQRVAPTAPVELPLVDLSSLPDSDRIGAALHRAQQEVQQRFDLERGPMMRNVLLCLGSSEHVLVTVWHHMVADNRAILVFLRELMALLDDSATRSVAPLSELPFQYADYARWQRASMAGDALEKLRAYWAPRLLGAKPFEMQTDHTLLPEQEKPLTSFPCDARAWSVPPAMGEALAGIARASGATLSVVVLATLFAWLNHYSKHRDISVTSSYHGHDQPHSELLFGYFARPLLLRTDLSDDPTFEELVSRIKDVVYGAFTHAELPLFEVAGAPTELISRMHVVYQDAEPHGSTARFSRWFPLPTGRFRSRYLFVGVFDRDGELSVSIRYNTDAFRPETIDGMLEFYRQLLARITEGSRLRISELSQPSARV